MKKKFIPLLASLALIAGMAVSGTVAFLTTATEPITNTFVPAAVSVRVDEELDIENGVKSNVRITNTGDTGAYIRANVMVSWVDSAGNVYAQLPDANQDYSINWTLQGWVYINGDYYHQEPVAVNGSTGQLLTECKLKDSANVPDGYMLSVDIMAQGIQSTPVDAVKEAWGVSVTGTTITG